jgi:hypothetical protein
MQTAFRHAAGRSAIAAGRNQLRVDRVAAMSRGFRGQVAVKTLVAQPKSWLGRLFANPSGKCSKSKLRLALVYCACCSAETTPQIYYISTWDMAGGADIGWAAM